MYHRRYDWTQARPSKDAIKIGAPFILVFPVERLSVEACHPSPRSIPINHPLHRDLPSTPSIDVCHNTRSMSAIEFLDLGLPPGPLIETCHPLIPSIETYHPPLRSRPTTHPPLNRCLPHSFDRPRSATLPFTLSTEVCHPPLRTEICSLPFIPFTLSTDVCHTHPPRPRCATDPLDREIPYSTHVPLDRGPPPSPLIDACH